MADLIKLIIISVIFILIASEHKAVIANDDKKIIAFTVFEFSNLVNSCWLWYLNGAFNTEIWQIDLIDEVNIFKGAVEHVRALAEENCLHILLLQLWWEVNLCLN